MIKNKYLMLALASLTITSSFAIFERTRNFFSGRRSYDDYEYYDRYGRRYDRGYYRTRPRTVRYVRGPVTNKTSVTEDRNNYIITIVLPGFQKEDVSVSVVDNTLEVNARGTKIEQSGLAQQPINSYRQTIPLDDAIDASQVESEYINGVLKITAPKLTHSTAAKGVDIPVK